MIERFDAALEYHRQDLQVIPLKAGEKTPALKPAYDRPSFTLPEYERYFLNTDNNIGVVCGLASRGFFVVDVDDRKQYRKYKAELDRLIRTGAPVVETRRGFHIWVRCPEAMGQAFDKVSGIDLKASGHVVVPPSLLQTGQLYLFREELKDIPVLSLEQIPFKNHPKPKTETELIRTEAGIIIPLYERPHGIPARLFNALYGEIGTYSTRSEAEQALIVYCVNNEWTLEQVKRLFDVHATAATKYKEKEEHAFSYLKTSYANAVDYLTVNRRDIDKQIDALSVWAEQRSTWTGRTALTDKAVFQAVLSIARRTGKLSDIFASSREIAEMSGYTFKTASTALKRIPFLSILRKDVDPFTPAIWEIKTPTQILSDATKLHIPTHSPGIGAGALNHDLFRYRGIGKTGREILSALGSDWLSVRDLSALSNINRRTVERKIDPMKRAGLIEVKGKGYGRLIRRIDNADLTKAAEVIGTAGTAEKQRARHKAERQAVEKIRAAYRESVDAVKH